MRRFTLSLLTAIATILIASMALAAGPPKDMRLSPPHGMKASKQTVMFSHSRHGKAKIECTTCHHKWNKKGKIRKCSTTGCHDQPGKRGRNAYYSAFHGKKSEASCLGCHKQHNKQHRTKLPVSCKHCHK